MLLALRALGAPVAQMDDVARRAQGKSAKIFDTRREPVIVAWDGRPSPQSVKPPTLESNTRSGRRHGHGAGPRNTPSPRLPPAPRHDRQRNRHESLVISAPRAHFPLSEKAWGVFAPLYALHSKRSFGAGDLTDLGSLIDWMHAHGGQVISTLPLLPGFLEEPFEPSPYSPISRLFWNEFYLDPARAPEFAASTKAQRLMQSATAVIDTCRLSRNNDAKRRVLEALARSFFENARRERSKGFRPFHRSTGSPERCGKYAALRGALPTSLAIRKTAEQYYLYAQWLVQSQLRDLADRQSGRRSSCYLDLPLGLHRDSFDAWRYPQLFVKGMSGGAPPDPVFTTGQNWSFQPIHPQAMRADGYKYAIAYIRNHLRYAKLLRIDHVMGLHRLYWIPEGLTGDRGLYVQYPAEEMYAILSLESHRADAGIVGENLGVVPPAVNRVDVKAQRQAALRGAVRNCGRLGKGRSETPSAGSVASLNTHDLFPFQGFIEGTDIDERLRLKFITPKDAVAERKDRRRIRKALPNSLGKTSSMDV